MLDLDVMHYFFFKYSVCYRIILFLKLNKNIKHYKKCEKNLIELTFDNDIDYFSFVYFNWFIYLKIATLQCRMFFCGEWI